MKNETTWEKVKIFINSYEVGDVIKRKDFFLKFPECAISTSFDIYRLSLTKIKILEPCGTGFYRKKYDIPESLTTTKMYKLENKLTWYKPDWKDWFMDYQDRLNRL
jgi:hypothetical protein